MGKVYISIILLIIWDISSYIYALNTSAPNVGPGYVDLSTLITNNTIDNLTNHTLVETVLDNILGNTNDTKAEL
jgi:hypothetical protein